MVHRPLNKPKAHRKSKAHRGGRKERFVNTNRGRWERGENQRRVFDSRFWDEGNESPELSIYRENFRFATHILAHDPVRDPPEFGHDPDNGHPRRVNVGISLGRRASMENVGKDLVLRKFRSKKNLIGFFLFSEPKKIFLFRPGRRRRRTLYYFWHNIIYNSHRSQKWIPQEHTLGIEFPHI